MSAPESTSPGKCAYLNLQASETGLAEFHKTTRTVFIPRNQVEAVEVKFGQRAERPLLQMFLGIALVTLGIVGLWMAVNGGLRGMYWGLGFAMFGGIGLLCLHEALSKGYYLRVTCTKETRKLIFRGVVEQAALSSFVRSASSLGYVFHQSLKN
jgi:hypothetical protein